MWLFLFLKMLFFKKKKINLWVHGWYGKEKWYEAFMKKKMYNIADGIFVYGDFAKKNFLNWDIVQIKFLLYIILWIMPNR